MNSLSPFLSLLVVMLSGHAALMLLRAAVMSWTVLFGWPTLKNTDRHDVSTTLALGLIELGIAALLTKSGQ